MGDAGCNDFDREAFHIADGLVSSFAVTHHPRNLQCFGDPAAVFLAVQVNRQIHFFIIQPQAAKRSWGCFLAVTVDELRKRRGGAEA